MPIFEFHCPKCDEDFEKIVFNDKTKVQCPNCNSSKVSKKIS
ncbi:MAG: FmdB family zinc ribbon protein, partial [Planctomycetaceae bacterium]